MTLTQRQRSRTQIAVHSTGANEHSFAPAAAVRGECISAGGQKHTRHFSMSQWRRQLLCAHDQEGFEDICIMMWGQYCGRGRCSLKHVDCTSSLV